MRISLLVAACALGLAACGQREPEQAAAPPAPDCATHVADMVGTMYQLTNGAPAAADVAGRIRAVAESQCACVRAAAGDQFDDLRMEVQTLTDTEGRQLVSVLAAVTSTIPPEQLTATNANLAAACPAAPY